MNLDEKFQSLYNQFLVDPENLEIIIDFQNLARRAGRSLPNYYTEIIKFCNSIPKCVMSYIEAQVSIGWGDPANSAYFIFFEQEVPHNWIMGIIQEAKSGNPPIAAANFAHHFRYLTEEGEVNDEYYKEILEWAKKIIESSVIGDPSTAAHDLYRRDPPSVSIDWIKKVVENDRTGNPAKIAFLLAASHSDVEWAKKVIEKAVSGDISDAVMRMEGITGNQAWGRKMRARRGV